MQGRAQPHVCGKSFGKAHRVDKTRAQPHTYVEKTGIENIVFTGLGSTPRICGKHFLVRLYACNMSEMYSFPRVG